MRLQGDDWSRKIPVEAKMLLMQILNIESKVNGPEGVIVMRSQLKYLGTLKRWPPGFILIF
jgi:hypothetical protein